MERAWRDDIRGPLPPVFYDSKQKSSGMLKQDPFTPKVDQHATLMIPVDLWHLGPLPPSQKFLSFFFFKVQILPLACRKMSDSISALLIPEGSLKERYNSSRALFQNLGVCPFKKGTAFSPRDLLLTGL